MAVIPGALRLRVFEAKYAETTSTARTRRRAAATAVAVAVEPTVVEAYDDHITRVLSAPRRQSSSSTG